MFPKKYRFSFKNYFKKIQEEGKRISRPDFTLISYKLRGQQQPSFAVVVSKKISKKAVCRNQIKRLIFNLLSKQVKGMNKETSLVFFIKKNILSEKVFEINSEILNVLKNEKIISK